MSTVSARTPFARARWLAAALVAASAAFAPVAHADDDAARLSALEAEARNLASNLPLPDLLPAAGAAGQRKLTDAQVAYSLGDYDAAALTLFDLANRRGPDQETAMFYLAEALYQKGDRGAARGYYEQV